MIRAKQPVREIVIDLTGPDGNWFSLAAWAHRNWRLALDPEDEIADAVDDLFEAIGRPDLGKLALKDRIVQEMQRGDYEEAVRVFDSYFGHCVILER